MGNETRRRPSVSSEGPSFQKGGLHLAHPGIEDTMTHHVWSLQMLGKSTGKSPQLCSQRSS
jgi:hypothetical protein